MRTPSLLAQCLPGLVPQDRASLGITNVSDRDVRLPSPAVEILPSKVGLFLFSSINLLRTNMTGPSEKEVEVKTYHIGVFGEVLKVCPQIICILFSALQMAHPYKYAGENVELQGLNVFKVCFFWCFLLYLAIDCHFCRRLQ